MTAATTQPTPIVTMVAQTSVPITDGLRLKDIVSSNVNLKTIGEAAFSNCNSLAFFSVPTGVDSIGSYAFEAANSQENQHKKVYISSTAEK